MKPSWLEVGLYVALGMLALGCGMEGQGCNRPPKKPGVATVADITVPTPVWSDGENVLERSAGLVDLSGNSAELIGFSHVADLTIQPATRITFALQDYSKFITVDLVTGEVTYPPELKDPAKEFWIRMAEAFPDARKAICREVGK